VETIAKSLALVTLMGGVTVLFANSMDSILEQGL
jgi:hypothetical protein